MDERADAQITVLTEALRKAETERDEANGYSAALEIEIRDIITGEWGEAQSDAYLLPDRPAAVAAHIAQDKAREAELG